MPIFLVKKRSGSMSDFDPVRIQNAIRGAYTETGLPFTEEKLAGIADAVAKEIEDTYGEGYIPDVELIQDIVEKKIAEKGDFVVAKAYILFRKARAEAREEKKKEITSAIEKAELTVKKRSGKIITFDVKEIEKAIENVCSGFENCFDTADIVDSIKLNIYDGMPTSEINKAIIMALKSRIEGNHTFSYISARFLINDLYKETIKIDEFSKQFESMHRKGFATYISKGIEGGRLDKRLAEFNLEQLAGVLDVSRDKLFKFFGVQVLHDRYFLRDNEQKLLETPQYFWMRVAMGEALLEGDKKNEKAIEFYNAISQMLYVPSTPTLLHSGTHVPQMSSCFLSTVEDDLDHIFKVVGDNAQLSKWSGGVANDWTNIRATNALVKSINTGSQGVIPFLKVVDSTTASINRSGKRRGAACMYLETWHLDIEEFLDLRKNTGDDRRRTHDLNTANWIPDLFMKRVIDGAEWTLFSPNHVPELHHIYGSAFEKKYQEYEQMAERGEMPLFKKVPAKDLWRKMVTMLFETGHPWITFKDPSNIRSPQDHAGVVHSSNLCTEITLNTSKDETAVCNLGSINLMNHMKDGQIDWDLLKTTVTVGMRMLDNVIDISFYPIKEAAHSNKKHRPVGLGIMGLQNVFFEKKINFDTVEAVDLSDEIMEFISWHAIMASSLLAKEKGAYESFRGSKWDRNIFPVDTIPMLEAERGMSTEIMMSGKMDWAPVRESVKAHGMRNSNTMAIAPTATISNISGCLPSIEPIYKNIYVKSNFSGDFTVVNEYLVADLQGLGLWTEDMLNKLKHFDGKLDRIGEIPSWIKAKYKEAFQIDPYWVISHAARRGKWIDQSQSINMFMNTESGKMISDAYIMAWKMGLKTTYYLRTLGASSVEKSTIDINATYESTPKEEIVAEEAVPTGTPKVHVFVDTTCESCQ